MGKKLKKIEKWVNRYSKTIELIGKILLQIIKIILDRGVDSN